MSVVHCFTSATFAYLDRARVLARSLRRHNPEWKIWLCLCDREPVGFSFDQRNEPFDNVVRIEELGIPNLPGWIFQHNVVELCTAVKGQMLCYLLNEGAEKIVYFDPDIAIFSDLTDIEEHLDNYNILLTPHQLDPDNTRQAIIDNEIGSLKYGIYNLGFLAISNNVESRRFAAWWRDRLLEFCFDAVPDGLFTDQRWCDHVPVFFNGVHILRDPGYNVASWNLSQRPLTIRTDGLIRAGNSRLQFFHFTKITGAGSIMIERYFNGHTEALELINWYRNQLDENAACGLPERWWAFGHYNDGISIPDEHRLIYRTNPDLRARFPNPFLSKLPSFREAVGQAG